MRLGGQVGLSVVGYSVRDGEPFLGRFPGWADACVGLTSTQKGKLDLCYGSMGRLDRNGVSRVKVATTWLDVHELSRSVQI